MSYSPVPETVPISATETYHDFLVETLANLHATCPRLTMNPNTLQDELKAQTEWVKRGAALITEIKAYGRRPDQWRFASLYLAEALVGRKWALLAQTASLFDEGQQAA